MSYSFGDAERKAHAVRVRERGWDSSLTRIPVAAIAEVSSAILAAPAADKHREYPRCTAGDSCGSS